MNKDRSRLDRVLSVAAITTMILATGSLLALGYSRLPPPEYWVGETFDGLPEWDAAAAGTTTVLWINTHCGACSDSVPFYRALSAAPRTGRLVIAGREPQDELVSWAKAAGISYDAAISVGRRELKFPFTPVVLVIDQHRRILRARTGSVTNPSDHQYFRQHARQHQPPSVPLTSTREER
jgi:hypothetical protein